MEFEEYLVWKNDEIDNAAYALSVALLRTDPKKTVQEILPWDMELLASITEATMKVLLKRGKEVCWPYYGENETPCLFSGDCIMQHCYLKNERNEPT